MFSNTHAHTHTTHHPPTHTHSFRMLEADVGRTVFPDYDIIVTKSLFSSAEEFTQYVSILHLTVSNRNDYSEIPILWTPLETRNVS